ncbi:ModC ABC-type molybdate transport system, ATPase component [Rhabdaerophilaceae bacterium]
MIAFSCQAKRGEFTLDARFEVGHGISALTGPSGAGKSTIIRMIAGLDKPDSGEISVGGTVLLNTGRGLSVPPHRRRIGLVFQDALLFPHLTVRGNLGYGRWFTPHEARTMASETMISVLGIEHLLGRYPHSLSGGERQRVAIGRALLSSPRLLLLDEPLASLDQARKDEILPFIERLRDEFAIPMLYVSHSENEVRRLASTIIAIRSGRVERQAVMA